MSRQQLIQRLQYESGLSYLEIAALLKADLKTVHTNAVLSTKQRRSVEKILSTLSPHDKSRFPRDLHRVTNGTTPFQLLQDEKYKSANKLLKEISKMENTASTHHLKLADDLFLIAQPTAATGQATSIPSTEHILVIDCSGSMWDDLPLIREQLKSKLKTLLREADTLSIVWFSGKGQHGILCKHKNVFNLGDLAEVFNMIDRWLRPVGLTGFKEPLEDVELIAQGIPSEKAINFIFLSDGWDNQWRREQVIAVAKRLSTQITSATVVEYGWYADRKMLSAIAQAMDGAHIFAENFDSYRPRVEAALTRRPVESVVIKLQAHAVDGFVWTICDGTISISAPDVVDATVSEKATHVFYLSSTAVGTEGHIGTPFASFSSSVADGAYAALQIYANRMDSNTVYALLSALGDVALIKQFSTCFTKQEYSNFISRAEKCTFDGTLRWKEGVDFSATPSATAFTIFDLLEVLMSDPNNRVLLESPNFNYNTISRKRVSADENLSAPERRAVEELTRQLNQEQNVVKVREIQGQIDEILENKKKALEFQLDLKESAEGYPISFLTFNETRPNISIGVKKRGTVDLVGRDRPNTIPTVFRTHIYRNYALIRDGLVNVSALPCRLTAKTRTKLRKHGVPMAYDRKRKEWHIQLDNIPVLNRSMVTELSAVQAAELETDLLESRAAQKVFKYYLSEHFPEKKDSWNDLYGEDGKTWLKENGITVHNGFSPRQVAVKTISDVYIGRELKVRVEGFSSLPPVKTVLSDMKNPKKKLNGPAQLMAGYIQEVETFMAGPASRKPAIEKWLRSRTEAAIETTRMLLHKKSIMQFSVTVGQAWFKEFDSLSQNTIPMPPSVCGDRPYFEDKKVIFELRNIEIKI